MLDTAEKVNVVHFKYCVSDSFPLRIINAGAVYAANSFAAHNL